MSDKPIPLKELEEKYQATLKRRDFILAKLRALQKEAKEDIVVPNVLAEVDLVKVAEDPRKYIRAVRNDAEQMMPPKDKLKEIRSKTRRSVTFLE